MRRLIVYLHTHWDREWYLPFETFRARLCRLVNNVIAELKEGSLPSFYLDGQACILEDVVEIQPEVASDIKELMASGRLRAGPWYVLADQMLVAGESLIRNLKTGLAVTCAFGEPAMVGYCPDTFGHSQDLPRVLAGFAIDTAIVWRGVPPLDGPTFRWVSPDGSSVIAHHLRRGYYQSAFHEAQSGEELAACLSAYLMPDCPARDRADPYCRLINAALMPVGGDHMEPPRDFMLKLSDAVKRLELSSDTVFEVEIISLAALAERLRRATASGDDQLACVSGELRDNRQALACARAYLLDGVLSSRLYLKRANRLAERRLIRLLEPLFALLSAQGLSAYPADLLARAWRLLLLNHPHDSICGCSVDCVHDEMMTRFRSFNHLLDELESEARAVVAGWIPAKEERTAPAYAANLSWEDPEFQPSRLLIYNLTSRPLSAPVRVKWAAKPGSFSRRASGRLQIVSRSREDKLFSAAGLAPYYKEVELLDAWYYAEDVPALGLAEFAWPPGRDSADSHPVRVGNGKIANGLLNVSVEASGLINVEVSAGDGAGRTYALGHQIIDVADGGDSYNFDPLPDDLPILAAFRSVRPALRGPVVGSLALTYELEIPKSLVDYGQSGDGLPALKRSPRKIKHRLTTNIELRRGLPIVFFETVWDNRAADHRLSVSIDTGAPVERTFAETHFSLTARSHPSACVTLPVPPGCEAPPSRFPCQRFLIANGQLFLNTGLPEYSVEGSAVSLTILRAVSMLSRGRLRTRGGGAGPHIRTPGANCLGLNRVNYGWAPLPACPDFGGNPGDVQIVQAYTLADQYEGGLWACLSRRQSPGAIRSLIEITNPALCATAVYGGADRGVIFVRILNLSGSPQQTEVVVCLPVVAAHLARLDDSIIGPIHSRPAGLARGNADKRVSLALSFGANELKTVRFSLKV